MKLILSFNGKRKIFDLDEETAEFFHKDKAACNLYVTTAYIEDDADTCLG
jgi:hypothetical protein